MLLRKTTSTSKKLLQFFKKDFGFSENLIQSYKALEMLKISSDCHIKICQSL